MANGASAALLARSQGLDKQYGLGSYAPAAAPFDVTTATPAQLQGYANTQAGSQLTAAEQPYVQQEKQTAAQYAAHGQAIQGFATALAQLLQGVGPEVQSEYRGAAGSQAAFAKGFSDAIQGQVSGAQSNTNSFLTQMGAPASAQHAPINVGDVTYGMGGYIPATTFNREGAAFTAAADQLPYSAGAQGLQDLTANEFAAGDANKQIVQQIQQLAATQPKLAAQIYNQLVSQQTAGKNYQLRENAYNLAAQRTQGTLTGTYTGVDGKTYPTAAAQKAADAKTAKQTTAHQKAVGKRDDATAKTIDTLTTYAQKQLGYRQIGEKPITKSKTVKVGSLSKTETLFLLPDGTYTSNANDPTIVKQPIYDRSHRNGTLTQPQFNRVWGYTMRYLKANLSRYGYRPADIQKIAHTILDPFAPPKAPAAPPNTATATNNTGGTTTVTGP